MSRPVQITLAGPLESRGNSGATLTGALAPGPKDFGLIDSRGGELRQWSVGQTGWISLLEGDFVAAELETDVDLDALLIETREVTIIVEVGE